MTPNSTVAFVVLAGPLGLILFVVVLLGGGASSSSGQVASGTGTGAPLNAPLNASAVPDPTWVPYIDQAGSLCPAITAPLIAAQDAVESDWAPNAVSAKGAEGIAQFMPATWPAYSSPPAVPGPDTPFVVPDAVLAQGRMDCALVAAVTQLSARSDVPALSLALEAYNAGLASVTGPGGAANMQAESYALHVPACPGGGRAGGGPCGGLASRFAPSVAPAETTPRSSPTETSAWRSLVPRPRRPQGLRASGMRSSRTATRLSSWSAWTWNTAQPSFLVATSPITSKRTVLPLPRLPRRARQNRGCSGPASSTRDRSSTKASRPATTGGRRPKPGV